MRFHSLADEAERGSAEAIYRRFSAKLDEALESCGAGAAHGAGARRNGVSGDGRGSAYRRGVREARDDVAAVFRTVSAVERVVAEAAAAYAALPRRAAAEITLRDVFLCGDIYLRIDEWGNDDLQRRLADLGLRPIIEPYGGFFELIAWRDIQDLPVTAKKSLQRRFTLWFMGVIVSRLLEAARRHQPWLFWNDVRDVERASREALDGYPFGESISSIGGALHTWRTQPVDGVVLALPRGCGPALISEAQLRRATKAPLLFVYNDGDPVDEARLAGFAWRLRSRPPRRAGAGPGKAPALAALA